MKNINLRRIKNYFYPLTKRPPSSCYGVSDLFAWRKDSFATRFELIDIDSLLLSDKRQISSRKGLLCLFRPDGILLSQHMFTYPAFSRKLLDINSYLGPNDPQFGTFALFNISNVGFYPITGSIRTDRGYTFYSYNNSELSVSVHGNLDAVALSSSFNVIPLSSLYPVCTSLNIQYLFAPNSRYDLFFANPSNSSVSIELKFLCAASKKYFMSQRISLNRLGSSVTPLPRLDRQFFIHISSRLILPRPLIFAYLNDFLEVFHS